MIKFPRGTFYSHERCHDLKGNRKNNAQPQIRAAMLEVLGQ